MSRERSGICLLFLALFGVGLVGVIGRAAGLAATAWFGLWRLSDVIFRFEIAMSSPSAELCAELRKPSSILYTPSSPRPRRAELHIRSKIDVPVPAQFSPSHKVFPNKCARVEAMSLQDTALTVPSG